MKIKKIHLDNVDDSGSRAISIKTSKGTVKTPTRSLSSSELMKLKNIRNESEIPVSPFQAAEEPFPWQIYESTLQYDNKIIKNMLNSPKGISNKRSNINSKINPINKLLGEGESKKLLKMIYPQIKLQEEYSLQHLEMLAEIQLNSNVDIIVLPETQANCNVDQFKSTIKRISTFLDNLGSEKPLMPMIHIHCNYQNFENKIEYLYDDNFMMAGILCHTYHSHIGLHILRAKSNKLEDFWVHGFGAWRNRRNSQLYNPHAAQVWGVDSVGIGAQGGFPSKKDDESSKKPIKNEVMRIYNEEDWGIYRVNKNEVNDLLCQCEACKNYNSTNNKQNVLDMHEALKSHEQNEIAREMILKDSYKELIKEKRQVKQYYESEIGDINQKSLIKWIK